MSKRSKLILTATTFLVFAALACGPATTTPERPYRIIAGDWIYFCADYEWLDNGDLQLIDCIERYSRTQSNPIITDPTGVIIEDR